VRVFLIEDNELLGDAIKAGLTLKKCTLDWSKDGQEAEGVLAYEKFDIIILDIGLPKRSGLKILEGLRARGDKTPIIVLTARDTLEEKVEGLNSGADDYITKPFNMEELFARVFALHRRNTGNVTETYLTVGKLSIHTTEPSAIYDERPLIIPPSEYKILKKLFENPKRIISKEALLQAVYGLEDVESNTLEVHIHNIRKKFPDLMIKTMRGIGYMLLPAGPVQELPSDLITPPELSPETEAEESSNAKLNSPKKTKK
jgi:two-component system response regulator QseB